MYPTSIRYLPIFLSERMRVGPTLIRCKLRGSMIRSDKDTPVVERMKSSWLCPIKTCLNYQLILESTCTYWPKPRDTVGQQTLAKPSKSGPSPKFGSEDTGAIESCETIVTVKSLLIGISTVPVRGPLWNEIGGGDWTMSTIPRRQSSRSSCTNSRSRCDHCGFVSAF